jgi:hypothetical protein
MTAYEARYPVGTMVRIASLDRLRAFKQQWKYHHPLDPEQLKYAGTADKVCSVGFYHGGDVLYDLENAPGTWHEEMLDPA